MKRANLSVVILTATALAGGAGWAAGTRSSTGESRSAAATVPGELAAGAWVPAAAPDPGEARATPTALPPDAARTKIATKAVPGRQTTPRPFVQNFAAQPGVVPQKPRGRPNTPFKVGPAVDGCDRSYGTIGQCIPVTFPKGVTDKCGWLTAHGFTALKVVGKDRQRLDPDRNGTACG